MIVIGSSLDRVRAVDPAEIASTKTGIGSVYNQGVRLNRPKAKPRGSKTTIRRMSIPASAKIALEPQAAATVKPVSPNTRLTNSIRL